MKNISHGFYIGIDSGGTKCDILITDPDGKVFFEKIYDGVHYSVAGTEKYSKEITQFINNILKISGLKLKNCISICIGAAGAREEIDRIDLKKAFQEKLKFNNTLITTDAMTALYGAFGGSDGIILISGTGSVLYGYSEGKLVRVGGWGRIIGDEGSGYWIGKRALNLVMKEYDRTHNADSMLSKKLLEQFGIDNKTVNEKVFSGNFEIQDIAPVVISCAEKKCRLSLQIAAEAVDALLEHIKVFQKVSLRKKEIEIAFIGSIIENKNIISRKLKSEIRKLKIIKVIPKKNKPSYGAVLLAMENSDIIKKL